MEDRNLRADRSLAESSGRRTSFPSCDHMQRSTQPHMHVSKRAQGEHAAAPAAAHVPGAQLTHAAEPAGAADPAVQTLQALAEVAPVVPRLVPAGQLAQTAPPVE